MIEHRFDVSTLGEVMLRLSVSPGHRLETATHFDVCPAGGEANMVALLSRLGWRCAWVGSLPDNLLGRLVTNRLRMAGVDLNGVVWCDTGRLGTFYVEFAAPPRPIQVIYDRANSCAARLRSDQIDWNYLLNSRLVHLTGITPALSAACNTLVAEAVERAKAAGVAISFDINYRQKLWSDSEARAALAPLIQEADLLICAEADARWLFGCTGTPEQVLQDLVGQSNARCVVVTLGENGVVALDGNQFYREAARPVQVVDRLGAGDALAAGVICGWLEGDLAQGLRYGVALAALALSQHGDMVVTTEAEVLSLLNDTDRDVLR